MTQESDWQLPRHPGEGLAAELRRNRVRSSGNLLETLQAERAGSKVRRCRNRKNSLNGCYSSVTWAFQGEAVCGGAA